MNTNLAVRQLPGRLTAGSRTPSDGGLQARSLGAELIDYGALVITLWERRLFIVSGAILSAVAAVVILMNVTSTYEATVELLLDTRSREVINIDNVIDQPEFGTGAILSEIAVIQSNTVLRAVAEQLELQNLPEFNPLLRDISAFAAATGSLRRMLQPSRAGGEESGGARAAAHVAADILRGKLVVEQRGLSYILALTVESESPYVAARVANAIAAAYLDNQVETKLEASRQATVWLSERARQLQRSVEAAEAAVERLRAGVVGSSRMSPEAIERQMAELSIELVRARTRLSLSDARAGAFRRLSDGREYGAAQQIASTEVLARLLERRENIIQQDEALRRQIEAGAPEVGRMNATLVGVENAIAAEAGRIAEGLVAVVGIDAEQVAGIERQIANLERLLADQSEEMIELRSLEREAAAQRAVYERFLTRLTETRERGDFQEPDARVLSLAEPPNDSSAPKRMLLAVLALILGGGAAAAWVVVADVMRSGLRTADEVRDRLGAPVLATLPREQRRAPALPAPREMRTAIDRLAAAVAARASGPRQVLLVVSALPAEGATRLTLRLAQASAVSGRRVAVADCNPLGRTLKQLAQAAGATPGGPVRPDGCDFDVVALISGDGAPSAEALQQSIAAMRAHYDLVLIDAPAPLAAPEALMAGAAADAWLLALRWNHTPEGAAREAIAEIESIGLPLLGVAMIDVDQRAAARYAYRGALAANAAVERYGTFR